MKRHFIAHIESKNYKLSHLSLRAASDSCLDLGKSADKCAVSSSIQQSLADILLRFLTLENLKYST